MFVSFISYPNFLDRKLKDLIRITAMAGLVSDFMYLLRKGNRRETDFFCFKRWKNRIGEEFGIGNRRLRSVTRL